MLTFDCKPNCESLTRIIETSDCCWTRFSPTSEFECLYSPFILVSPSIVKVFSSFYTFIDFSQHWRRLAYVMNYIFYFFCFLKCDCTQQTSWATMEEACFQIIIQMLIAKLMKMTAISHPNGTIFSFLRTNIIRKFFIRAVGRQKLSTELEKKLITTPFETYPITRGQRHLFRGELSSYCIIIKISSSQYS